MSLSLLSRNNLRSHDHGDVSDVMSEKTPLLAEHIPENIEYERNKTPTPSTGRKNAVMTSCLLLQFMGSGVGYGLAVMYAELIQVFDAKRADAALIQSLFMGITTGGGILWSGVIKGWGPGPCTIIGILVSSVGLFASAFASNTTTIIVTTGVISSMGMCLSYLSGFIAVSWVFHTDPGLSLVFLTIGSSIGQFVMPYVFELSISAYQWSGSFIIMSAIVLNCVPAGLVVYCSRRYYDIGTVRDATNSSEKKNTLCDLTLVKDPIFLFMLVNFFLLSATGNVEAWFLVDIMTSRGYARETGSLLVSMLGLANFIGRIFGGLLKMKCTRMSTIYHWIYLLPMLGVAHALVINVYDLGLLIFACMLYGVTFGVTVAQAPAIMYEATGLERYPQGMAFLNLAYGMGNFSGGLFGGSVKDLFGDYDIAFYVAVAASIYVSLTTSCIAVVMRRRRQRAQQTEVTSGPNQLKYSKREDEDYNSNLH